ncbi:hypothetical protein BJX96DRAFT_164527 [Aspergillus floccosus]
MPKAPPEPALIPFSDEQQSQQQDTLSASFLQEPNSFPTSSNKEYTSPVDIQTQPRPTASSSMAPASSADRVPDSQPQSDTTANGAGTGPALPAPLMLLLDSTRSTLRSLFSAKPPHTIQRLAELIIRPNAHYRTLPAYLRAVDRVVSVTSGAGVFPLQVQPTQPNGLHNGAETSFALPDHAMSGDESLGGALLTPIPWLNSAASSEGGDGVGEGLETIAAQPLQEMEGTTAQQTIVQSSAAPAGFENQAMEGSGSPPVDAAEDVPHARGPEIIGVEDMGLQDGHGVEMTLSTPEDGSSQQTSAQGGQQTGQSDVNDEGNQQPAGKGPTDGDGDIQLGDAKEESEGPAASAQAGQ